MAEITTHRVDGLNEVLSVFALDEPGQGNARHRYRIEPTEFQLVDELEPSKAARLTNAVCSIRFQDGPIREFGVNGISNEALLAVVRDRLEGFQSGEFACAENQIALESVITAMQALANRTRDRLNSPPLERRGILHGCCYVV